MAEKKKLFCFFSSLHKNLFFNDAVMFVTIKKAEIIK